MVESRTYIKAEVSGFLYTRDPLGPLSNMHPDFPIEVAGLPCGSTEAYYQAMRYPHLPDFQAEILAQDTPMLAKRHAYTRIAEARPDWLQVNVPVMRHALRLRYAHHPTDMVDVMHLTAGKPIVEISRRDNFWGAIEDNGLLTGCNVLGRLHMEMREIILGRDPELPYEVQAPAISGAVLCDRPIITFTPEAVQPAQAAFDI
jgi:ribA/ribD-fused uncharacterized protein